MENKKYYDSKLILTLIMAVFFGFALMFTGCSLFGGKSTDEKITEAQNIIKGSESVSTVDENGNALGGDSLTSMLIVLKLVSVSIQEDKIIHVGEQKALALGFDDTKYNYLISKVDDSVRIKLFVTRNGSYSYNMLQLNYSSKTLKNIVFKSVSTSALDCVYEIKENKVIVKSMTEQQAQDFVQSISVVNNPADVEINE